MDEINDAASAVAGAAAVAAAMAMANSPPPFLSKTYDMVDDPSTDSIVSWSKMNNSFVVWNVPQFSKDILPKYFKHNNFSSFVRQLNTYGFRKVDSDRWEFANEGFLRGQKHLLKSMSRRKPAHVYGNQRSSEVQSKQVGSCVQVGKFGIEEEVKRLKRDKNVLTQEIVRLRQQHQTTDQQLQTVGQRVQVMEQRQQQMMSFLAKAMQSPGFLAHLVQQQNESNRLISGVNKKRRLPNQEEESNSVGKQANVSPGGRIVKYQPLMNEAAKAMVRQILKMNGSPRLESAINNPSDLLIDDMPSPSNLDSGSSSNGTSGVSLSEVLTISSQPCLPTELGVPLNCHSATASEIQSGLFPEININSEVDKVLLNLSEVNGITPESANIEVSNMGIKVSHSKNQGHVNALSEFIDGSMPAVSDEFTSEPDVDVLLDEIPGLPGINDVFWEQFLSVSPLTGDTDEVSSNTVESGIRKEHDVRTVQGMGWNRTQQMNHLTKQLGLLTSEAKRG